MEIIRKLSLSARRAWIEMLVPEQHSDGVSVALRKESVDRNDPDGIMVFCGPQSLSARRAWIEIQKLAEAINPS